MKVGFGFDAHRLVPGRPLILGGCRIPFERGLEGYSDADVVAHALIDALLGAAAMGDCGSMFPAGNPEFAGADSIGLLRRAVKRLNDAGFKVGNVDCTIVAERPALAPHLDSMRQTLADAVGIAVELCSVKAKHTEGMGYTGEGIGMAAYAVAMLL
ncbi:MAG: 2-C-methyl-D-erythritol 2,4-cyclodiphosphate synthase [Candidatus Eremiobacteraeota bacterium]|nr:2-C-methyl-D-erythritol 2,4-cyclodiphosphate synthase [Candidatus Eremiobacteraeota bacterium]